jgi:hypothetical protein
MLLVGSLYWPMVHGQSTEQVVQDEEGMQVAYMLGANMAWLLNCLEAGRAAGVATPSLSQPRAWTNFIR